jgi:hypothetical protein
MKRTYTAIAVVFVLAFSLGPSQSQSAPTQVNSRAGLAGNDFILWSALGPELTVFVNPVTISSNTGNVATVSNPAGNLQRVNQSSFWGGNFAAGDRLLSTQSTAGPMVIEFDVPVLGAGAQIQAGLFGAFNAKLEAFDEFGNPIASFTRAGVSNANADNSAIFLGIIEDDPIIKRIEYTVDNATFGLAINKLDLVAQAAELVADPRKAKFTFYYNPTSLTNVDSATITSFLLKEPGTVFELPCSKDVIVTIEVPEPGNPSNNLLLFTQTIPAGTIKTCVSTTGQIPKKYRYTSTRSGINDLLFEIVSTSKINSYVYINKVNFLSAIRATMTPEAYKAFVRQISSFILTIEIDGDIVSETAPLTKGTLTPAKQELTFAY